MLNRFALAALSLAVACSSTQATGGAAQQGATGAAAEPKAFKNPDVITAEELETPEIMAGDALAAIQRLRPRFLMTQGLKSTNMSAGAVHISIDGQPLLSADNLHRLQPSSIKEIRYLSPSDAAQRYGTAAGMGGVILIKSK